MNVIIENFFVSWILLPIFIQKNPLLLTKIIMHYIIYILFKCFVKLDPVLHYRLMYPLVVARKSLCNRYFPLNRLFELLLLLQYLLFFWWWTISFSPITNYYGVTVQYLFFLNPTWDIWYCFMVSLLLLFNLVVWSCLYHRTTGTSQFFL